MKKKTLYARTSRLSPDTLSFLVTEKLDGSNMCLYIEKDEEGDSHLFIAQRNWVFSFDEILDAFNNDNKDIKGRLYKGLLGWILENGEWLENNLREGVILCGEWMGQGQLSYAGTEIAEHPYYMFAKAKWSVDNTLTDFNYDPDYFHYAFINEDFPICIRPVPVIMRSSLNELPEGMSFLEALNKRYDEYREEHHNRNVEGFVVSYAPTAGNRFKYVRMKNKKLEDHAYWGYDNGKRVMK